MIYNVQLILLLLLFEQAVVGTSSGRPNQLPWKTADSSRWRLSMWHNLKIRYETLFEHKFGSEETGNRFRNRDFWIGYLL